MTTYTLNESIQMLDKLQAFIENAEYRLDYYQVLIEAADSEEEASDAKSKARAIGSAIAKGWLKFWDMVIEIVKEMIDVISYNMRGAGATFAKEDIYVNFDLIKKINLAILSQDKEKILNLYNKVKDNSYEKTIYAKKGSFIKKFNELYLVLSNIRKLGVSIKRNELSDIPKSESQALIKFSIKEMKKIISACVSQKKYNKKYSNGTQDAHEEREYSSELNIGDIKEWFSGKMKSDGDTGLLFYSTEKNIKKYNLKIKAEENVIYQMVYNKNTNKIVARRKIAYNKLSDKVKDLLDKNEGTLVIEQ